VKKEVVKEEKPGVLELHSFAGDGSQKRPLKKIFKSRRREGFRGAEKKTARGGQIHDVTEAAESPFCH